MTVLRATQMSFTKHRTAITTKSKFDAGINVLSKKQEGKCDYCALNWRCRGLHRGTVDGLAKDAAMQRLEVYLSRAISHSSLQKTIRKVLITDGVMGGGRG